MSVMRKGACFNDWTAVRPPNPAPRTTRWGRSCSIRDRAFTSGNPETSRASGSSGFRVHDHQNIPVRIFGAELALGGVRRVADRPDLHTRGFEGGPHGGDVLAVEVEQDGLLRGIDGPVG